MTMQNDHPLTFTEECAELVRIPVLDITSYEAAAMLLAVLAYPIDKKARTRFEHAVYYKIIEHLSEEAEWKNSNQLLRPSHILQDKKLVDTEYKRGVRIIRESRMIAAKMAAPVDCFIAALANGQGGKETGGELAQKSRYLPPTSVDWIAEVSLDLDRLRSKDTDGNKGNIVARCWTPSKPILHLCLAIQFIFNPDNEMSYLDLPFEDLFKDPGLIMMIIDQARSHRNFTSYAFDIPKNQQIDLDWR